MVKVKPLSRSCYLVGNGLGISHQWLLYWLVVTQHWYHLTGVKLRSLNIIGVLVSPPVPITRWIVRFCIQLGLLVPETIFNISCCVIARCYKLCCQKLSYTSAVLVTPALSTVVRSMCALKVIVMVSSTFKGNAINSKSVDDRPLTLLAVGAVPLLVVLLVRVTGNGAWYRQSSW